jgi:hypothetical protein
VVANSIDESDSRQKHLTGARMTRARARRAHAPGGAIERARVTTFSPGEPAMVVHRGWCC